MGNFVAGKRTLSLPTHGFDCSARNTIDPASEFLADGVVEADEEFGFFGVGFAVAGGGGVLGYDGALAEGEELAVGGYVGDDVVYYTGGVAEGALGAEGLVLGEGA